MSSNRFFSAGSFSTARRSSLIFFAIGSGVPGGPISANQPSARGMRGNVSAMVGVSGRFGRRFSEPTARSLSWPPLIAPARLGSPSMITCTRPPMTSERPAGVPG